MQKELPRQSDAVKPLSIINTDQKTEIPAAAAAAPALFEVSSQDFNSSDPIQVNESSDDTQQWEK